MLMQTVWNDQKNLLIFLCMCHAGIKVWRWRDLNTRPSRNPVNVEFSHRAIALIAQTYEPRLRKNQNIQHLQCDAITRLSYTAKTLNGKELSYFKKLSFIYRLNNNNGYILILLNCQNGRQNFRKITSKERTNSRINA